MAKLVARLLATAAPWVRIQISLKNTNGQHDQMSGPPKKLIKKDKMSLRIHKTLPIETNVFPAFLLDDGRIRILEAQKRRIRIHNTARQ